MSKVKVYDIAEINDLADEVDRAGHTFDTEFTLKSDFDKLAEALKYYASRSNWTPIQFGDSFSFLINDSDIIEDHGGKLARSVLKELGIEV